MERTLRSCSQRVIEVANRWLVVWGQRSVHCTDRVRRRPLAENKTLDTGRTRRLWRICEFTQHICHRFSNVLDQILDGRCLEVWWIRVVVGCVFKHLIRHSKTNNDVIILFPEQAHWCSPVHFKNSQERSHLSPMKNTSRSAVDLQRSLIAER